MKGPMVKRLAENKLTANKMAEENHETRRGPKEVTTRDPKEVTAKDPKKVEQGNKLQEGNHRMKKRKEQYRYAIEVVLAAWVIGVLGYYLY